MTLKLIGAGFGRTGTLSLKAALEQIGYGPCHHMLEVFMNQKQAPFFSAAARGEKIDWDALLGSYNSLVDWPGAHFWRELAIHYPQAKVLLSHRDPEKWYSSFADTIMKVMVDEPPEGTPAEAAEVIKMASLIVREKTFSGKLDKDHAIAVYKAHNETVKRTIPPERLLVFDVAEGWEPLCKFLGVAVPATDFPRTNSREEFHTHKR
ncbi:MAG: sulfotransferase family protein [Parvibaculaceae bacterium]